MDIIAPIPRTFDEVVQWVEKRVDGTVYRRGPGTEDAMIMDHDGTVIYNIYVGAGDDVLVQWNGGPESGWEYIELGSVREYVRR